jgi:hypothetical protein
MFAYTVRQAAAPINYPLGGALWSFKKKV